MPPAIEAELARLLKERQAELMPMSVQLPRKRLVEDPPLRPADTRVPMPNATTPGLHPALAPGDFNAVSSPPEESPPKIHVSPLHTPTD